jgi:outer membrane biosynthesis protein TonB
MADVLIVCVREDEPQAKALADMFEAAGFTIGGAPSNDAALRSSGAGVVVWSQASIRSRPFLDAAQRVINSGKAVVASLIEPPPPSSIGDSPAFDLSRWDGDPNDASLDSLFFAVDRMVNAARAAVGAAPVQPSAPAYEAPPPAPRPAPKPAARQAPPPREPAREPPQREPASYRKPAAPASNEPLEAEAEHWRAIRDSRDPGDFMDYLARYGTDGAFSEVAEIKLKRLTGGAEQRPAARATPTREPAPTRRAVEPPPMRRAEAPVRRVETPAPRAPIDRGYDRADLREPPRREGGALRALLLVGLLGGAAAAAFVYFGRLPSGPGQPEVPSDYSAPPPIGEPAEAGADNGVSLSEAAQPGRVSAPPISRRDAQSQPQQRPPQRETQRASAENAAATPPPVTSWSNEPSTGGPVSLVPSEGGASSIPAPTQDIAVSANPSPANAQPAAPPARVIWTQTPSARRVAELYPASAAAAGTGGRVVLDCVVQPALTVECSVVSAQPATAGFDRAALRLASSYRARATRSDGSSAVGEHARVGVNFQPPR